MKNEKITLNVLDESITKRRTCRIFDENKKISFNDFSMLISHLRQTSIEVGVRKED